MKLSPTIKQIFYSLAPLLIMMNSGLMYGFPGILIPSLLDENSDLQTDIETASWIASMPGISGFITVFSLGPLMHAYGRRTAHLIFLIPMALGWILASVSHSIQLLIFARILQGLSKGFVYFCAICIGELTCPKLRGILLCLKMFSGSVGIGLIHLFGTFFHWRTAALIGIVPTSLSFVIALFWPESPEWLVSKQRYEEAEKSFFTIRDYSRESEEEIKKVIETEKLRQRKLLESSTSIKNNIKKINDSLFWRPVILLSCAIIIPEAGGRHFIPAYSVELAKQISNNGSSGYLYTCLMDVIFIVSGIMTNYLVLKFSRRTLIIKCGYFGVSSLVLASLMMYIRTNVLDNSILRIVSLVFFAAYIIIVNSSTFVLCYTILGELLPLEYRPLGTLIDGVLCNLTSIACVKVIPFLKYHLDIHGMFLVLASIVTLALVYMHYDLPETKDRSLHDITNYFKGTSPKVPTKKTEEEILFMRN